MHVDVFYFKWDEPEKHIFTFVFLIATDLFCPLIVIVIM